MCVYTPVHARQMTGAYKDATKIYSEFKGYKDAAGGGTGWGGLSHSLPGVLFRTHFKAKRYEEALPYIDEAITTKRSVSFTSLVMIHNSKFRLFT